MKPVIKYSGGKRREIKFFQHWIPDNYDKYIEPFVGGGAVYFYLEPQKSIINDINKDLINFYKTLANNRDKLIKEVDSLKNNEETYYKIRDMMNGFIDKEYMSATIYAYINRTAFSGMVRYNSKGHFNVPFGRYKNYNPSNFFTLEASELLQRTEILNIDFEKIFEISNEDDFLFLDPPYDSTFKDYVPGGFSIKDQKRLAKCFKNSKSKCLLVISDTPLIRELYKDYIKEEYHKTYAINVKNRMLKNNSTKHLIITNYDL